MQIFGSKSSSETVIRSSELEGDNLQALIYGILSQPRAIIRADSLGGNSPSVCGSPVISIVGPLMSVAALRGPPILISSRLIYY